MTRRDLYGRCSAVCYEGEEEAYHSSQPDLDDESSFIIANGGVFQWGYHLEIRNHRVMPGLLAAAPVH